MTDDGMIASLFRAAKWHWNLLGLGAGAAFAFLSGHPEAFLPIVLGLEIGYLGLLGTNERFQNVLRGQAITAASSPQVKAANDRFQQLASFLSREDFTRFETLRQRCAALLTLRRRMDSTSAGEGEESFRGESLDRMLWLFLKLLHQKSGLERFLTTASRQDMEKELAAAQAELKSSQARDTTAGITAGTDGRLTTSIRDRIRTLNERIQNHSLAMENWELACAEISKTEQQITHLCEVGMTSRDSADLGAQIDGISSSLQVSEKSFSHASVTAIFDDETPPPLLSGAVETSG